MVMGSEALHLKLCESKPAEPDRGPKSPLSGRTPGARAAAWWAALPLRGQSRNSKRSEFALRRATYSIAFAAFVMKAASLMGGQEATQ